MLNIFNLFLFLFTLWVFLMISSGNISWLYLALGIFSAAFISVVSYKVRLIEERSELLYLSFGFYHHFLKIYFGNFFSALNLVIDLAFRREPFKPVIHAVNFNKAHLNLALFATTINMTTGLFCIGMHEGEVFIHAAEEDYFKRLDLKKLIPILTCVNDDNLV